MLRACCYSGAYVLILLKVDSIRLGAVERNFTSPQPQTHVNYSHLYFVLTPQHWTEELMHLAYSSNQLNGSSTTFLQKAHTRLCVQVDKSSKIPVKK